MLNKKIWIYLLLLLSLHTMTAHSGTFEDNIYRYPVYLGAMVGYGSTTWEGLVPSSANQNLAMAMFTPVKVQEGGETWGLFGGYEFTPWFALEANYYHYANAKVYFDDLSVFAFLHDGITEFITRTETMNVMAKIMLTVPETKFRVYSSAGIARIHREDMLADYNRISPTFGIGVNYHITQRVMLEIAANYTAGYGESQLNPAETYFPFLYSVTARLAFTFNGFN